MCVLYSFSDSNDSSEEDSGNFAISSSSRSNAANTSSSFNNNNNNNSNNNNNVNVPSTSTGITSNFRGKLFLYYDYLLIMEKYSNINLQNMLFSFRNIYRYLIPITINIYYYESSCEIIM